MTSKSKTDIKAFFQTGDTPTESQCIDLIDSYVDKSGPIGTFETACSAGGTGPVIAAAGIPSIVSYPTLLSNAGVTVYDTATALTAALTGMATTAQATTGTVADVFMDPVKTRNAIQTLAFTSATSFSTTAQANAGTDASTVMNPVTTKNAIATLGGSAGAYILLSTQTASASATLDFTSIITSTYSTYIFEWDDIRPATDGVDLIFRTSTNNGSSYDAAASDYAWSLQFQVVGAATVPGATGDSADTDINLTSNGVLGNAAAEGTSGRLTLRSPLGTARNKSVYFEETHQNTSTADVSQWGHGTRLSTADIDAVRFMMSSGNITSGSIRCYGLKAA